MNPLTVRSWKPNMNFWHGFDISCSVYTWSTWWCFDIRCCVCEWRAIVVLKPCWKLFAFGAQSNKWGDETTDCKKIKTRNVVCTFMSCWCIRSWNCCSISPSLFFLPVVPTCAAHPHLWLAKPCILFWWQQSKIINQVFSGLGLHKVLIHFEVLFNIPVTQAFHLIVVNFTAITSLDLLVDTNVANWSWRFCMSGCCKQWCCWLPWRLYFQKVCDFAITVASSFVAAIVYILFKVHWDSN